MKAHVYYDDLGKDERIEEIPDDMKELAEKYHAELIEKVAECDESLMEKYFEGEELTERKLRRQSVRRRLLNEFVPVLCGTAYRNKGVQDLLDAVIDFMPAPIGYSGD